MSTQTFTTPAGEQMVVLPRADYEALLARAEDAEDAAAVRLFNRRMESGEEERVPADVVARLVAGENPVRVWRQYRDMSMAQLAAKADVATAYVSQIETGKRVGRIDTMKKIADALNVAIDDLV